jgi:hypothetical protein
VSKQALRTMRIFNYRQGNYIRVDLNFVVDVRNFEFILTLEIEK